MNSYHSCFNEVTIHQNLLDYAWEYFLFFSLSYVIGQASVSHLLVIIPPKSQILFFAVCSGGINYN